jgi:hypothetical protein
METYRLLKTQKNEMFKILQKAGLECANFSWKRGNKLGRWNYIDLPRLEYIRGQYYFEFEPDSCTFSPAKHTGISTEETRSWTERQFWIREWVKCLKKEIKTPDFWVEMEKYKLSFSLALPERPTNEPISASETEKIAGELSLLADRIKQQFELDAEHGKFVRDKLSYLSEAAKRQRSVDWVHTLIGVSVTIVVGLGLAPDKATELWQLINSN